MINLIMGLVELLTSWIVADFLISCIVLYLPFQIIYSFIYYNLFKKMGISKWFVVGLFFLELLFLPFISFSKEAFDGSYLM